MKVSLWALLLSISGPAAFASGVTKIGCRTKDFLVGLAYPLGEVENISGDIRNLNAYPEPQIVQVHLLNDGAIFEIDPDGHGVKFFSVRNLFSNPVLEVSAKTESSVMRVLETSNCSLFN